MFAVRSALRTKLAPVLLAVALAATGCGSSDDSKTGTTPTTSPAAELRLGYFANVTHAGAVYGVASGGFQKALGSTTLKTSVFNAGPAAIEAMRGGALDAAFLGPGPAINGFSQTKGELLRIVAGTTTGGASLVVKPSITSVDQLNGKKIATPQLGNTQDIAAKAFFKDKGVKPTIINQDNSQTLDTFKAGKIDGGWLPEPWASRLVLDGGGKVLVDEATLWPGGKFVTTHLVVRQAFLKQYPATVKALLSGLIEATDAVGTKSQAVQDVVNGQIEKDTGKKLKPEVLAAAFAKLTPTVDPAAASLAESAKHAEDIGLLKPTDLKGIYDLSILNELLKAAGKPEVDDANLGV
ncbi:MAG: putative transporter substrate-binding protein [Frankiales bacterium]|nr:putative transporter substrate-binding protein [Frankiales bacterium]